MNADSNPASPTNPEISALRQQLFILLTALVIVSGTLTVYLFQQSRLSNYDLNAIKKQSRQIITDYTQNKALIGSFESQLIAYGQTHPDFRPVLMKYGLIHAQPATNVPKQ